jgi:predicted Zn-dependent protease
VRVHPADGIADGGVPEANFFSETALKELQKANPNDPFIQCMIGQTYEKLGDKGKAVEYY